MVPKRRQRFANSRWVYLAGSCLILLLVFFVVTRFGSGSVQTPPDTSSPIARASSSPTVTPQPTLTYYEQAAIQATITGKFAEDAAGVALDRAFGDFDALVGTSVAARLADMDQRHQTRVAVSETKVAQDMYQRIGTMVAVSIPPTVAAPTKTPTPHYPPCEDVEMGDTCRPPATSTPVPPSCSSGQSIRHHDEFVCMKDRPYPQPTPTPTPVPPEQPGGRVQ
jgi:hypothetical protein